MNLKRYLVLIGCIFLGIRLAASSGNEMRQRFMNPLNEDRPWVYWYWLNGNVTEAGLLADLEAMKAAGIGTAMAFDVGLGVEGKLKIHTDEWFRLMKKVILKADELGLKIGFHGPGWANTGGPWIDVENSMKELIWNETVVNAKSKRIQLVKPKGLFNFYQDITVLAYPKIKGDEFKLTSDYCIFTDTLGNVCGDVDKILDNDRETCAVLPGAFDITFRNPQLIRNIDVRSPSESRFFVADVFAYDEQEKEYKYVTEIRSTYSGLNDCPGMGSSAFSPVNAKRFRLKFKVGWENENTYSPQITIQELHLNTGYRLHTWGRKAGFGSRGPKDDYVAPIQNEDIIDSNRIIDLTDKLAKDGMLNWKPDSGEWTVLRLGYVSTGARPGPDGPLMQNSLECDKFSVKSAKIQYDNVISTLFELVGKDVAHRVFSNYHSDSYEAGWQNWSEVLPDEFQKRRGYELKKHLVSLTGRVVNSVTETENFLWDFRRTMADCYAENHVGYFSRRAEADGLFFSTEAYDGIFEDLQAAGHAGMPMTEIWNSNNPDLRPRSGAIHAGHIYGRNRIGSEQFTGLGDFSWHPWKMKCLADASMAYGINNFVMHVYTHQPWTAVGFTPGKTLGPWGVHYDRGNTWWKESRAWHDYLARCQYMLRQGMPVADILYFVGDNAPDGGGNCPVNAPIGYEGDALNGEILQRITAQNGDLILPGGKRYKYLVMPEHGELTLASLLKIRELVDKGITLVGTKPICSHSLVDVRQKMLYKQMVYELFEAPFTSAGRVGRVLTNKRVEDIIAMDSYQPDFKVNDYKGLNLKYTHRSGDGSEIYYVTNSSRAHSAIVECQFRVEGMTAQEWIPLTGEIRQVLSTKERRGVTTIPIHFEQGETKFIVFTKGKTDDIGCEITDIKLNGESFLEYQPENRYGLYRKTNGEYRFYTMIPGDYTVSYKNNATKSFKLNKNIGNISLSDEWQVSFDKHLLSPLPSSAQVSGTRTSVHFPHLQDWSKHQEEGVKYYSGTATYTKNIMLSKIDKSKRYLLDLGEVNMIAHVYVNGKDMGTLWKPPFVCDLSSTLKEGENKIEIEITNLWINRLIGDEQYPDDCTADKSWNYGDIAEYPQWVWDEDMSARPEKRRVAFTTFKHWKANDNLQPSGLVGPVNIYLVEDIQF